MKKKLIFLLLGSLLLVPWPAAYAYGNTTQGDEPVHIEVAAPAAAPHWNAYGNAIGGVTPGDLFYIDTGDATADLPVTLYITNTDELVHYYRYLTLNVGVYAQSGSGQWQKATAVNGESLPDTYITMLNGSVSFTLKGNARYKITLDKGCFYCYGTANGKGAISPTFYLTAGEVKQEES